MSSMYDPLRHKEVPATPEERVRQWFIELLRDRLGVPSHMMMSEVGFELNSRKMRADILVYDKAQKPLAVVECKRPEVNIDEAVLDQAVRYNFALDVRLMILTNGKTTFVLRRTSSGVQPLETLPTYEQMLLL